MIAFVLAFSVFFYNADRLQMKGTRTIEETVRVALESRCNCILRFLLTVIFRTVMIYLLNDRWSRVKGKARGRMRRSAGERELLGSPR